MGIIPVTTLKSSEIAILTSIVQIEVRLGITTATGEGCMCSSYNWSKHEALCLPGPVYPVFRIQLL